MSTLGRHKILGWYLDFVRSGAALQGEFPSGPSRRTKDCRVSRSSATKCGAAPCRPANPAPRPAGRSVLVERAARDDGHAQELGRVPRLHAREDFSLRLCNALQADAGLAGDGDHSQIIAAPPARTRNVPRATFHANVKARSAISRPMRRRLLAPGPRPLRVHAGSRLPRSAPASHARERSCPWPSRCRPVP